MRNRDKEVLRALAFRVAELGSSDSMSRLREEWKEHNALRGGRPMVCVSPEGAWREIIREEDLLCQDPMLREFEYGLRQKIYWAEEIRDDTPVSQNFSVPYLVHATPYLEGAEANQERVSELGSFHYTKLLENLEEGLERLRYRQVTVDLRRSEELFAEAQEAFGDLLHVRYRCSYWWTLGLTAEVIRIIGLEDMMLYLYDDPEGLHRLMAWLSAEHANLIGQYENLGILTCNNEDDIIASGGIGYTDELPCKEHGVELRDLWGFAESQETVGISPEMFGEFIFPYQLPLLERFGLNCYGCCEPVEDRWKWIETIPRLRRVSVSPWSDKERMAELLGKDYIFSRKPNPSYVCNGFHEEAIRAELKEMAGLADQIHLEIILKDTHTLENHPERLGAWVDMARRAFQ